MNKLISSNQGAFLEGRWIAENALAIQEVIHKIHTHKGKHGLMALKIDLKKAYDLIEWRFCLNVGGF